MTLFLKIAFIAYLVVGFIVLITHKSKWIDDAKDDENVEKGILCIWLVLKWIFWPLVFFGFKQIVEKLKKKDIEEDTRESQHSA